MGSTSSNMKKEQSEFKDFVNWFEIPVLDIHRAAAFYSYIYNFSMEIVENNHYSMAFFPADEGVGGALVQGQGCVPSETGPLLYLNGGSDLISVITRVEDAGGRVIMPKTLIAEDAGYFAIFIDTEGNKLALHSKN
jgi:predicted enzyme related to lactoylglutathione lyase